MLAPGKISCSSEDFAAFCADLLRAGNSLRFRAEGISMQPLIQDGDTLTVVPVAPDEIQQCDILLLKNQHGRALVHRVIHKQNSDGKLTYQTKGDHAHQADGLFSVSNIFGRLSVIERNGRLIKTDQLLFKFLSRCICWYSRKKPRQTWMYRIIFLTLRRLPIFKQYLT